MIAAVLALLTSAWAWLLPYVGPIAAKGAVVVAGGRSWIPKGVGGPILALAAGGLLAGLLVWKVGRWWNPPPRTYTAAEIRASSLEAENRSLREAIQAREQAIRQRDASIERLAVINDQVTTEMESARAQITDPDSVVVPADDRWLREWHRRGW